MRRQWARALGMLLGYLACVLGIRLVDALETQLSVEDDWELTRGVREAA